MKDLAKGTLTRRAALKGAAALSAATVFAPGILRAQAAPVRMVVCNDLSGPYIDNSGRHTVEAVKMAIDDFGGKVLDRPIEFLFADDQGKPDMTSLATRQWFDNGGIDAYFSGSNSPGALAALDLVKARNTPFMLIGPGNPDFTGKNCSPVTTQWIWNSYALSQSVVASLTGQNKMKWYLITFDNTFGAVIEKDLRAQLEALGGELVGVSKHPYNTTDFASFLVQAQGSGADVVAIGSAGNDLVNLLKQANEFGISQSNQRFAMLSMSITQVKSLGLNIAKNLEFVTPFYHDMNDETREWSKRLMARDNDHLPNLVQAGAYSAAHHYLKAVTAAGTTDGPAVMAKMKELPVNDFFSKDVAIRADGQVMRPMYYAKVKTPDKSSEANDLIEVLETIPPEKAWQSLEAGGCKL